ncbi:MAG TPA: hypothetical protein VH595_23735 [Verrucomicrobiae bacterium]|jgi:hypothetical protein|nr:hypothetical protein [Verrucomicrobiae bacterium]
MKRHLKNHTKQALGSLAALALAALCQSVQADISTIVTSTNIAWPNETNALFYVSTTFGSFDAQNLGAAGGAAASSLSETFTITNGAGTAAGTGPGAGTNYVLTGIGMVISGYSSAAPVTLHLYDVTSNLTSANGTLNGSGASYNFYSPAQVGDLLGEGQGLPFYNDQLSGAEQVIYIGLQNGPNTYDDQVVLASNHTYAVEVSVPTTSQLYWGRNSAADPGGQGMGSANSAPDATRTTINALGLAGGAPRTFMLALYGSPTILLTPSANGSTNIVFTTNYWVDQFNALSVLPVNPYYTNGGTDIDYSAGDIGELWGTWFGDAATFTWDNTKDAQGDTNNGLGGSMEIQLDFTGGDQLEAYDGNNGITPTLNGEALGFTSFECDVMFDSSSAVQTNYTAGAPGLVYFGNLQFGTRTAVLGGSAAFGQDYFGNGAITQVPQTLSNQWVHVKIPVSALSDANIADLTDIIIHIYSPFGNGGVASQDLIGPVTFWVDNMKFKAPLALPLVPPPSLKIQPAIPATARFFTTAPQYTRTDLATSDFNQSWIGGPGDPGNTTAAYSQPVSYSVTFKSLTSDSSAQTTLWLVEDDTGTYNGNDYSLPTELWLNIVANPPTGWTAQVAWKANDPGANPTNIALTVTNTVGVGTWTLTFTGETTGTLMAPGWLTPSNFTIADPNVATDFGNPLTALFGIQGNGTAYGAYDDVTQISITNVAGANELDLFASDTDIETNSIWSEGFDTGTPSGYYQITNLTANDGAGFTSAYPTTVQGIILVTTNTPFWVSWNVTTNGYGLGESATGVLPITSLISPASFSGYTDVPLQCVAGTTNWALIPNDCLAPGKEGFFEVVNPPPQQ